MEYLPFFHLFVFVLLTLICCLSFFYFYHIQNFNRHSKKLIFFTFFFMESFFAILSYLFFSPIILITGYLIIFLLPLFLFYQLKKKENWIRTLFHFLVCQIVCYFTSYIIIQMAFNDNVTFNEKDVITLLIIFERLSSITFFFFLLIWKKQHSYFPSNSVFFTLIAPVSHTAICFLILYYWQKNTVLLSSIIPFNICLCCIIPTVVELFFFHIILTSTSKQELLLQINLSKRQTERNRSYYQSIQEYIIEIQDLENDFNHKIQQIYQMASQKNSDSNTQAFELIHELEQKIEHSKPSFFCDIPIINTIFGDYAQKIKERGASFEVSLQNIDNSSIKVDDLSVIFSFLLSDALSDLNSQIENPYISISTYKRANFFIIEETHSMDIQKRAYIKDYHQILVKKIIEKYDGDFQINYSESITTTIVFPFFQND